MKTLKVLLMAVLTILAIPVFAQNDASNKTRAPKYKPAKAMYNCPMHPDMVVSQPGKCATCGMGLVKSKKEKMKMDAVKIYTCPRHPEITSNPCQQVS